MKPLRLAVLIITVFSCFFGTALAIRNNYSSKIVDLSEEIHFAAEELAHTTNAPDFDSLRAEEILTDLKGLIKEYEVMMIFAESPYPGELLLGTTPPGDDTWLETLCSRRYDGPLKEIRIRRTGHRARYLRINDIEITGIGPNGVKKETFNKSARVRLYTGGVFKLALPRPMKIERIRILTGHESTGLQVYGIPYRLPTSTRRMHSHIHPGRQPSEVLLGTTPAGKDTWLETLCSNPFRKPIREIRIKRTGSKATYLRINDIKITYMTPAGIKKAVLNKNGRIKLYSGGVFRLSLPTPMMIRRIRILTSHESTGLQVYGVY
jgi:hypothetical protein